MNAVTTSACQQAVAEPPKVQSQDWQERFSRLLPTIRQNAHYAFRRFPAEARQEAIQDVIVACLASFHSLVQQGREEVATASSLARYAVAHYRVGRSVAYAMNCDDVTSAYCQHLTGIRVESLQQYDTHECRWLEILVEDQRATPADVAITRIDFQEWPSSLSPRMRKLAETLATGESTSAVAELFRVSAGRISQVRRRLMETWDKFHAEEPQQRAMASA